MDDVLFFIWFGWLVLFYGILTRVGYLMPNHAYTECFNIHGTHVSPVNSTNNNVFFFVSDL